MPINMNNAAENENLEKIFQHLDDVQSREQYQTYLTEILKKGDLRIKKRESTSRGAERALSVI